MSEIKFILSFFCALALSLIFVPALIRLASMYGILDKPDDKSNPDNPGRKIHKRAIPGIGGAAIVPAFLVPYYLFQTGETYTSIVLISLIVFLVGLTDDIKNISPKIRIIIQAGCALAVVVNSNLAIEHIYFNSNMGIQIPYFVGVAISVFIIIGAINSTNMSDGLDGLAAGLAVIGIIIISLIHYIRTEDLSLIVSICLPVIGATLGFLRYNTHPASVFMGDSGSNWLGFILGILFLILLKEPGTSEITANQVHLPFIFAFMGSIIPVIDTASVIFKRVKSGVSPATADKNHFHHSLLRIGLSHSQSVIAIYFLALMAGISGVVAIAYPPPKYELWALSYLSVAVFTFIIIGGQYFSESSFSQTKNLHLLGGKSSHFGKRLRTTIRHWETFNKYIVYLLLAALPAFASGSSENIGYIAGFAALVVLTSTLGKRSKSDFLDSMILVIGVGVLLFSANQEALRIMWMGSEHNIQSLYNYLFYFLFFSSSLFIIVTMRRNYLVFTPSDFLMASVPLLLLIAPEPYRSDYRLGSISLRCLVFFMVLRTFAKRRQRSIYNVKIIVLLSLIYILITSAFGFRIL